ncbi:RING finger protein 223 isoform X2 [Gouania willdenowi]|uniref:RING finger protein 223 isoform X2 n=1 Tax=Gouania willdenowi TaxID=441366 RepID=UPI0010553BF5|nr:RING finger protein 223-like isoform X2 [Gouania willdenowi]
MDMDMDSELECRICYRTYNPGPRCPRDLQCKHAFCEKCLQTLSRLSPRGAEGYRLIVCPLCRVTTTVTGRRVGAELRVSERLMERLLAEGLTEEEEEEEEEEVVSGGRLRRTWRKVWRKIRGDVVYFPKDEFRDLSLLSFNWF